jgi:hypothetical protein
LSRLVAVKVFQLDAPPVRRRRLVAELEALVAAELVHPVVAAPLARATDGIIVYLVQELVRCDSLDVVMRDRRPVCVGDALHTAEQLAAALDFAAAVDVRHGGLHPRDVLISPDEVRLTGLGVAGAIEKVGLKVPLRHPYAAPERAIGKPWDRRADVFSLAAVTYEMFWGRRLTAVGEDAACALTDLPGGDLTVLQAVFARALAARPNDRFDTAREFTAALKEAFPVADRQSMATVGVPLDDAPILIHLDGDSPDGTAGDGALETFVSEDRAAPSEDSAAVAAVQDPGTECTADTNLLTMTDTTSDAVGELELRAQETVQGHDVTTIPEPVAVPIALETAHSEEPPPTRPLSLLLDDYQHDPREPPVVRTRSSVLPVAAALLAGIALGFGGGYTFAARRRAPSPSPVAAVPGGREWTENAVKAAVPPEPDAPVKTSDAGRLIVRSTPGGGQVFVDGREEGRTPATVLDLTPGTHWLRVALPGYIAEDRRIVVTAEHPIQTLKVELKLPATTAVAAAPAATSPPVLDSTSGATLSVDSRPDGARVFIDGRLVGKTPVELPRVGPGEHAIRLELDTYRRWSSSVRVVAGERNRVTASLER